MNKLLLTVSLTLALASTSTVLYAEADAEQGEAKAAACASCHGPAGNSMMGTFPKLAQQHASYLVKQLAAFKNGTRKDPMMSGMAMGLSDDDMADIAEYYAEQKISANAEPVLSKDDDDDEDEQPAADAAKPKTMPELMAQGADLYRNGDLAREVSACIACHGPAGDGNQPAAFPMLKSQHPEYLIKTLNDYKSGARATNPDNIMRMIAKKMTDEEIKAVAYRISMMK
ncbi:c-type cytochrome [Methylosoma difficile]